MEAEATTSDPQEEKADEHNALKEGIDSMVAKEESEMTMIYAKKTSSVA